MERETLLPELDESSLAVREVIDFVSKGLAFGTLERAADAYGLTQGEMAEVLRIPPRTLQRRRSAGSFDAQESERLYRYIRLFERACDVFDGRADSARAFLTEPQPGLGGAIPLDVARSEYGASEVMDLLGRIDYGVYT